MREVRFFTAARTCTVAITVNAMVPAARNTSSAISMLAWSRIASLSRETIICIGQTLKLTMRNMMTLPTAIQQPASPSATLVMFSCQTLA